MKRTSYLWLKHAQHCFCFFILLPVQFFSLSFVLSSSVSSLFPLLKPVCLSVCLVVCLSLGIVLLSICGLSLHLPHPSVLIPFPASYLSRFCSHVFFSHYLYVCLSVCHCFLFPLLFLTKNIVTVSCAYNFLNSTVYA